MRPILTVVGATGTQGGSVVSSALASGTYHVRALTRNANSEAAQSLVAQGAEVVTADLNDEASLIKAFNGSAAIYTVTNFMETFASQGAEKALEVEVQQGKNMANAAMQTAGLKHFIWSTLPDSMAITKGKHNVPHFQGKAAVDTYIKSKPELLAKTTFLWVTWYASNINGSFFTPAFNKPFGKFVQLQIVPASVPLWTIGDTSKNLGKFTNAILSQPHLTQGGKYVLAYVAETTLGGQLSDWSKATGKESIYLELSGLAEYIKLGGVWGEELGVMMQFFGGAGRLSWSAEGEKIVLPGDLGIKVEELVGDEEAFRNMDWSAL